MLKQLYSLDLKFKENWPKKGSKRFSTSVFRKATFNGVFRNFDSFIFESDKTDLIFTLLFRCFTICLDLQSFHLEVEKLRQIFKCNNYPVGSIDQCVKTFLNKIYVPKRILIRLRFVLINFDKIN